MARKKTECSFCGRKISLSNIGKHERSHSKLPKKKKIRGIDYDPNSGYRDGSRTAWNKGLTKNTDHRIAKQAKSYSDRISKGEIKLGGWKHTEETKSKLSSVRKEFLKNNPDKVPYLLNHSSKKSYPEKYFEEIFDGWGFEREYRVGLYSIDFALIKEKIAIEIDGEQHYVDKRIVEHDIRRSEILENDGWTIYRIRWSHYQKLSRIEKENFIEELKVQISSDHRLMD